MFRFHSGNEYPSCTMSPGYRIADNRLKQSKAFAVPPPCGRDSIASTGKTVFSFPHLRGWNGLFRWKNVLFKRIKVLCNGSCGELERRKRCAFKKIREPGMSQSARHSATRPPFQKFRVRNNDRMVLVQYPGRIKSFIFCRLPECGKRLYPSDSDKIISENESICTNDVEQ